MSRAMLPLITLCLAAAASATPAAAASFNCAKAAAPDEIAVCADPGLSELDSEMGALWFAYSQVPMLMGMNGNRQDEARAFLAGRAACGANAACLRQAYVARIGALKQEITSAMQTYCTAG